MFADVGSPEGSPASAVYGAVARRSRCDFGPVKRPISGVMNDAPANESAAPVARDPAARSAADVAEAARLLAVLLAGGDARRGKVRTVRRSVRGDTYENDLKLSVAVDRMADEAAVATG